ncbi:hypothetical protein QA584_22575 [Anaerocolumna sp. AGMB13025]|uniref:hypothetical protein n=1 Tax=Anaerocolumna sp. AGMB13025 TaxID=3039116 RepID=UPI00241C834C|nr:hypothetical protein [Anaerocolumna sp. AGMB13025]WFR56371.1 hypothetical protein QA584_22575 [Anaerocolumna sp. AGMB13025]
MKKIKKMLSRILALALVAVFFTAPTSALAATPQPVLVTDDWWIKAYEYQPTPLIVKTGFAATLHNTTRSDNKWYMPADKEISFDITFAYPCSYKVIILRNGVNDVYYSNEFYNSTHTYIELPATPTDGYYQLAVIALSDTIAVKEYLGFFYTN